MAIENEDFDFVRSFAKQSAAIVIEPDRQYLVEARLTPVAQQEGYRSLRDLVTALRTGRDLARLHTKVLDALTTNETLFFRDLHPFEALRSTVLPDLIKRSAGRKLRIWSAACSTGQEPYSIAMMIKENFPALGPQSVQIRATDLAERVLEQARTGSYSQLEINRGLPAMLLVRYFTQDCDRWKVRDDLKAFISFEKLNLTRPWAECEPFDLVLMRNVLIYFEREEKARILAKVAQVLRPDGYFVMGSAETTIGLGSRFKPVQIGKAVLFQNA